MSTKKEGTKFSPYSNHVAWQQRVQQEKSGEKHSLLYGIQLGYFNGGQNNN